MQHVWGDWQLGITIAAALAVIFGLLLARFTPRGPVSPSEALSSMAAALGVGVGAGLATGDRWSLVVAPAVLILVFEIARAGTRGATVGPIRLDSSYGILAFVVGRVLPGMLIVVPMVLGAAYGILLARLVGHGEAPMPGAAGWALLGVVTVAVVGLAAGLARPAATAPITGSDGEPLAGSVAELVDVPVGGHDQAVMIRGRSVGDPVLLYLAGGPGGTDLGAMRLDASLEQHFVVATWDQRGCGKSYLALDPAETLTLDQAVRDTIEVTGHLRSRFGEERIYLVGNSWGSTLGVLAVRRHPELFHAFVGVGQMVSQRETDVMFWEDTLAWAERTGDDDVVRTLRRIGPPPYADVWSYAHALSHEHDWNRHPEMDLGNEMPAILMVPEYTWMDRLNGFRGLLDTASLMYPQLQEIDLRRDARRLAVPVYVVQGEHEARGRAALAGEWFGMLRAPRKELVVFAGAGHRAHFDRPGEFAALMRRVLDETRPGHGSLPSAQGHERPAAREGGSDGPNL